jgi:RNA polymerase sigma factor (sigma-70 family)
MTRSTSHHSEEHRLPWSIAALQEHDKRSWAAVWQAKDGWLRTIVRHTMVNKYRLSGDEAEVKEISQRTWIKAYYSIHEFEANGSISFDHWLTKLQCNQVRMLARKREALSLDALEADQQSVRPAWVGLDDHYEQTPEEQLISSQSRMELISTLQMVLDELGERDRQIFLAFYQHGLSAKEVGALFGIKPDSVHTRMMIVRKRLRGLLLAHDLFNSLFLDRD